MDGFLDVEEWGISGAVVGASGIAGASAAKKKGKGKRKNTGGRSAPEGDGSYGNEVASARGEKKKKNAAAAGPRSADASGPGVGGPGGDSRSGGGEARGERENNRGVDRKDRKDAAGGKKPDAAGGKGAGVGARRPGDRANQRPEDANKQRNKAGINNNSNNNSNKNDKNDKNDKNNNNHSNKNNNHSNNKNKSSESNTDKTDKNSNNRKNNNNNNNNNNMKKNNNDNRAGGKNNKGKNGGQRDGGTAKLVPSRTKLIPASKMRERDAGGDTDAGSGAPDAKRAKLVPSGNKALDLAAQMGIGGGPGTAFARGRAGGSAPFARGRGRGGGADAGPGTGAADAAGAGRKRGRRLTSLASRLDSGLNASRFRWLNENLYTTTGVEALNMFRKDREAFDVYHAGFRRQVESWPENPVDRIISILSGMPKNLVVADLGCGEARLSAEVPQGKVHSFDLVAPNKRVTVANLADLPLPDRVCDVAVFSLALMGTDYTAFLREAHRVLKDDALLLIAEVRSRIPSVNRFADLLATVGFKVTDVDDGNKMFVLFRAERMRYRAKESDFDGDGMPVPEEVLLPCIYKRR